MNSLMDLSKILGEEKTREEVMQEIRREPEVYSIFLDMQEPFQEQFIQFCMGVRGMKMTYDTYFKHIFNAETHPEQRAACYAADMVMRQYERQKSALGKRFTYQDMKKVYTIVFMENSAREVKEIEGEYLHRGKWTFDSDLKLELLTEFFFVSIDNFFKIKDNKEDTKRLSELEAWLYFIGSDKPEHISKVVESHPWFAELYTEVAYFRHHPKEAIGIFSEALAKLDENTVNYMIDEMKEEIAEKDEKLREKDEKLEEKERELEEKEQEILELRRLLEEKNRMDGTENRP